jgi:hypothetical protein
MKTHFFTRNAKLFLGLIVLSMLVPLASFSQNKRDKKVRMQMVKIVDGQKTVIDTTFFSTKDALEYRVELEEKDSLALNSEGKKVKTITVESNFSTDDSTQGFVRGKRHKMVVYGKPGGQFEFQGEFPEMPDLPDLPDMPDFPELGNLDSLISLHIPDIGGFEFNCPEMHNFTMKHNIDSLVREAMKNMPQNFDFEFNFDPNSEPFDGNFDIFIDKNKGKPGKKHIRIMSPRHGNRMWPGTDSISDDDDFSVRKFENGDKTIIIVTKVEIDKPNEADKLMLKKAGAKVEDAETTLKPGDLTFYPNPNDGKFELSFDVPEKNDLVIKIYDMNGKEIYSDKRKNFEGSFSDQIDISKNGKGTCFLQIRHGSKKLTKKVLVQ